MTINMDLSEDSINAAIRIVEQYKKDLLRKSGDLVDILARDVDTEARRELNKHVWSGETLASLQIEKGKDTKYTRNTNVTVGGAAVWLEFGTGVVANACSPGTIVHPVIGAELVVSGIGTYGEGHGSDPNGWYWEDEIGESHHTYGIPATMFMWNAAQRAKRELASTARRVFMK